MVAVVAVFSRAFECLSSMVAAVACFVLMIVLSLSSRLQGGAKTKSGVRKHEQREQTLGDVSENLLTMIHKAIPMDQASKI